MDLLRDGLEQNFGVLKEPRGFLRCVETIASIFAFSTISHYYGRSVFNIKCDGGNEKPVVIDFKYPFRLSHVQVNDSYCNATMHNDTSKPDDIAHQPLYDSSSSSAQFFVAIGVLSFLYCLFTLLIYLFFDRLYRADRHFPIIDFTLTASFAFFWLFSSIAWAAGLHGVIYGVSFANWMSKTQDCGPEDHTGKCHELSTASNAEGHISVLFGFMSFVLWAGNTYFVYKETKYHASTASRQAFSDMEPESGQSSPQRVNPYANMPASGAGGGLDVDDNDLA